MKKTILWRIYCLFCSFVIRYCMLKLPSDKPDDCITICVEWSTAMIIAKLSVLMAGCAYVPLDQVHISQRQKFHMMLILYFCWQMLLALMYSRAIKYQFGFTVHFKHKLYHIFLNKEKSSHRYRMKICVWCLFNTKKIKNILIDLMSANI